MSWSMNSVREAWERQEDARIRAQRQQTMQQVAKDLAVDPGALAQDMSSPAPQGRWCREVFNDFILVSNGYGESAPTFKVPYTVSAQTNQPTFGTPQPVKVEYVPLSNLSAVQRVVLSADNRDGSVVMLAEDGEKATVRKTMDGKAVAVQGRIEDATDDDEDDDVVLEEIPDVAADEVARLSALTGVQDAIVELTERHVRTPEGQRKYGEPIGSLIVKDPVTGKMKAVADTAGKVGKATHGTYKSFSAKADAEGFKEPKSAKYKSFSAKADAEGFKEPKRSKKDKYAEMEDLPFNSIPNNNMRSTSHIAADTGREYTVGRTSEKTAKGEHLYVVHGESGPRKMTLGEAKKHIAKHGIRVGEAKHLGRATSDDMPVERYEVAGKKFDMSKSTGSIEPAGGGATIEYSHPVARAILRNREAHVLGKIEHKDGKYHYKGETYQVEDGGVVRKGSTGMPERGIMKGFINKKDKERKAKEEADYQYSDYHVNAAGQVIGPDGKPVPSDSPIYKAVLRHETKLSDDSAEDEIVRLSALME